MAKSLINFIANFWWVVILLKLMPIGRDSNLDKLRLSVVTNVMVGFKINIVQIITNELHAQMHKTSISLLFPCLVTKLCKLANVPILSEFDAIVAYIQNHNIN